MQLKRTCTLNAFYPSLHGVIFQEFHVRGNLCDTPLKEEYVCIFIYIKVKSESKKVLPIFGLPSTQAYNITSIWATKLSRSFILIAITGAWK